MCKHQVFQMDVREIMDRNTTKFYSRGDIVGVMSPCFLTAFAQWWLFHIQDYFGYDLFPKLTNSCSGWAGFAFCCHVLISFFSPYSALYTFWLFGCLTGISCGRNTNARRRSTNSNPHLHGMVLDSPQELYLLFVIIVNYVSFYWWFLYYSYRAYYCNQHINQQMRLIKYNSLQPLKVLHISALGAIFTEL